mgnify:CR=1 FL=1
MIHTVHMVKNNILYSLDFPNFEDAYAYFRKNKHEWQAGDISRKYEVTEVFYSFDNREQKTK